MPFDARDYAFMARALTLAERGRFTTTPNPRVGCVVVRSGDIVGQGYHEKAGAPHAEVLALRDAGILARGATVYVTLEPCNHFGRTAPCVQALIEAGVARVVVAMRDPNHHVPGEGLQALATAGIVTESGLLEDAAMRLNRGFVSRMRRGRPWVTVKVAASADGRTALKNGESQWITGDAARRDAHRLRAESCAILTGIGTVLSDNPRLNVREVMTTRSPAKIVLDTWLRLPVDAQLLAAGRTIVFTASADPQKIAALQHAGAEVVNTQQKNGRLDLRSVLEALAERQFNQILVEAGAILNGALIDAQVVDELVIYHAPTLLGDGARGMFGMRELTSMNERITFQYDDVRIVGGDVRLHAFLTSPTLH